MMDNSIWWCMAVIIASGCGGVFYSNNAYQRAIVTLLTIACLFLCGILYIAAVRGVVLK